MKGGVLQCVTEVALGSSSSFLSFCAAVAAGTSAAITTTAVAAATTAAATAAAATAAAKHTQSLKGRAGISR